METQWRQGRQLRARTRHNERIGSKQALGIVHRERGSSRPQWIGARTALAVTALAIAVLPDQVQAPGALLVVTVRAAAQPEPAVNVVLPAWEARVAEASAVEEVAAGAGEYAGS